MEQMEYKETFEVIAVGDLLKRTHEYQDQGYRLVQLLPKMQEDGNITLIYSFGKLNEMINLKIPNVVKGHTTIPSVTSMFISAFVFENEAHDLFGVNVVGNSLDFQGHFYMLAEGVEAPMTIVTPAQLAAREKKAKLAKAKAAREAAAKAKAAGAAAAPVADDLEARLAGMDPEKAAKVRAAMKAKAAKEAAAAQAAKQAEIDEKVKNLDPEKAAKVRAALEAKAKREAAANTEKEGE